MDVTRIDDAMSSARSGMSVAKLRLDVSANNLANMATNRRTSETPFRPSQPMVQSLPGGGAVVTGLSPSGSEDGVVFADPLNALADTTGHVRAPDIDVAGEMVQMMVATKDFEANAAVFATADATYKSVIDMMKPGRAAPFLG